MARSSLALHSTPSPRGKEMPPLLATPRPSQPGFGGKPSRGGNEDHAHIRFPPKRRSYPPASTTRVVFCASQVGVARLLHLLQAAGPLFDRKQRRSERKPLRKPPRSTKKRPSRNMVGREADSAIHAPLALVEDALATGNGIVEVESRFRTALELPAMRAQVPRLDRDAVAQGRIMPNTLVRFRGLVQDMWNPEYYVGSYKDPSTGSWKQTHYMDCAAVPENTETQLMERKPLVCISVPGEARWCAAPEEEQDTHEFSTSADPQRFSQSKRPRDMEEDDAEMADVSSEKEADHSIDRRTKRQPCDANTSEGSASMLEFPWKGLDVHACLVKLYGDTPDSLRLNDVVDFYGLYTVSPELTVFSANGSSFQEVVPPGSQLPRLHCIFFDKLGTPCPDFAAPESHNILQQANTLKSAADEARNAVFELLRVTLGGDSVAAEFLLLQLLSRVQRRTGEMTLGCHSLNLAGCESTAPLLETLLYVLQALCPRTIAVPMTLESFNEGKWTPKKNYDTGRLEPGILQVADGTQMLLDETQMQAGNLGESGLRGLEALKLVMETQQLEYDFQYYKMSMPTDIAFTILSHGKSLLAADTVVPLRMQSSPEEVLTILKGMPLAKLRGYLWTMRGLSHDAIFQDSIKEGMEERIVAMRQKDKNLGPKDFHRLLNLSKLMAASHGRPMDVSDWDRIQVLDAERRSRLN